MTRTIRRKLMTPSQQRLPIISPRYGPLIKSTMSFLFSSLPQVISSSTSSSATVCVLITPRYISMMGIEKKSKEAKKKPVVIKFRANSLALHRRMTKKGTTNTATRMMMPYCHFCRHGTVPLWNNTLILFKVEKIELRIKY